MKISIVGVGKVGATLAHTIVLEGLADRLVLVNRNHQRAVGHALDLQHAASLVETPVRVVAGSEEDTADSDVVVCCLSAPMPAGQTERLALAEPNVLLYRPLIPRLSALSPRAVFVVISNPVDVMTWATLKLSGLPPAQVCGVGTLVDSARYRSRLSLEFGVHADDIRAYVIGEHGSSQVAAIQATSIGGERIDSSRDRFRELAEATVECGQEVLRAKGYTNFSVATAAARVLHSIREDDQRTMPLSVLLDGFCGIDDVCLSLPVVMGRQGVSRILRPALSAEETAAFKTSAERVRAVNAAIAPLLSDPS